VDALKPDEPPDTEHTMCPAPGNVAPVVRQSGDPLVRVNGASKRFCRSLKKSLWYGVCDIASEFVPGSAKLRSSNDQNGVPNSAVTNGGSSALDSHSNSDSSDGLRPDEFWAVKNVSFELQRGECLGLIGHNGAGKTTLLKMLTGLIKLDRGRIEIRGRTGALIALGAGFNPVLTGRENIYVNGSVLGLSKREINAKMDEILDFAEIGEFIDAPVQNYSSGMNVRLGFAVAAVLIEPDVLFLDEVLAVGDISFKYKCFAVIGRLMQRSAVVLVSHDMGQVQRICSSVMFLSHGQVRYHGSDVAGGIQRYQASMGATEEPRIAGTGQAKISRVAVLSASKPRLNDKGLPVVSYGEDLHVQMEIELPPQIPGINLIINLLDQAGAAVAQCNSADQGFSLANLGVPSKVTMRLPQLPLSPGIYRLWIIARHRDRPEALAVYYGVAPFQVVGHFIGYIAFQPLVQWHAEPAGDAGPLL
jgi:lipopolysaccharide transport system ATP-binding protein